MIETITAGIIKALDSIYPNIDKYSTIDVPQGISMAAGAGEEISFDEYPAFFVALVTSSEQALLYPRFSYSNMFDIHYFPLAERDNGEMRSVASNLYPLLDFISLPDGAKIRGTNKHYRITDGVLHFFVNFNGTYLRYLPEVEKMEEYDQYADDVLIGGYKHEQEKS